MLVSDLHHLFLAMNGQPHIGHILPQNSQGTSGSTNLLISMAVMLLFFVLLLTNNFEVVSGAGHETLCTSNACYTLNMVNGSFETANHNCTDNGGYLMTVRDREEEDVLRLLLSQIKRQHREKGFKFWIGLKLHSGHCVSSNKSLKGFKWVSGKEDSNYSNWEKEEPAVTCTQERCVMVRDKQLKWIARSCKSSIFYACKFYFQGMCKPLALLGPGEITYTLPFSKEPPGPKMQSLPHGTYAEISCSNGIHSNWCILVDGVYHWKDPGPFCKQNCMINNGGCEHLCHQGTDQVQCSCKEGYSLDKNGFTCRTKDLCDAETCEGLCIMGESGYSCKCPNGFKLDANQRTCSDIDECQSQVCEHLCINTHGNYTCACKNGYQMVDGKCSDIDECTQQKCEHGCSNGIGSYSCYCRRGFTFSEDGHSCVDINECVSNRCQFKCVNTNGSFLCTCPQGFRMETDGLTCTQEVTEASAPSSNDPDKEETQENFTESLTRTTVELQHQSPHTDAPPPELVNITHRDQQSNTSSVASFAKIFNTRVIICVLGSVIPLLILVSVTLAIMIFRCSRTKKEAKKNTTTDGYCWVSSGLDPRLEKLYESILTDDL